MNSSIDSYLRENRERFLSELIELLKFPSISSLSEHQTDIAQCAAWLKNHLSNIGMENCEVYTTKKHPIVYADCLKAGADKPTLLIYGHYDVQPVDPLDLWDSGPFEPVIKGDIIFARGASDDKGQFFAHFKALETLLKIEGALPINVKVIIEGEEEIGSHSMNDFMRQRSKLLACDLVAVSDSPMYDYGLPTICYGLRGLAYLEITVTGPNKDLHSGSFGGVIANPIEVLTKIVAQLKDDNGKITIPGFYDKVLPLSDCERENFAALPFDEDKYLSKIGANALFGEAGYTTLERAWVRPTLDPNGIYGGFTAEGAKTVIPSFASCKISMRLVPNQNPEEISDLFENYIPKLCPPTVKCDIKRHHGGQAYLLSLDSPVIKKVANALKCGFGKAPVYVHEGGSIPIVASFKEILGSDTVLLPLGLPDENAHSPNENFHLPNFYAGIKTAICLLDELKDGI